MEAISCRICITGSEWTIDITFNNLDALLTQIHQYIHLLSAISFKLPQGLKSKNQQQESLKKS